jgi:glycosyltransferase involved in cell wall biosynthesis
MKVKLLISTTAPETIVTILAGQPKWLAERFDVALITSPGPFAAQVAEQEEIEPILVPMARRMSPFADLRSIFDAYRALRRIRPSIVHSYTPKAGLVMMIAARMARVPIRIHTFTGLIFPTRRGVTRLLLIVADRIICAKATHVIAEGRGVARDLAKSKITRKPLTVLANGNIAGVDLERFDRSAPGVEDGAAALKDQFGIAADTPVLGYVGRLNRDKGLDELLAAFSKVKAERAAMPPKLLCVGEHDTSAPVSAAAMAQLKSDPDIICAGWQKDIRSYLAAMDVLILPSYREGFPNVLLQAGAMRLPLIATDVNGSNEIVLPGETGLLVAPGDARALGDAILTFLEYPYADRAEMGAAGQRRVRELFSQATVRAALLDFYQELAAPLRK